MKEIKRNEAWQIYEWGIKIKEYCNNNEDCDGCPFQKTRANKNGYCLIGQIGCIPEDWEIDEFESDE